MKVDIQKSEGQIGLIFKKKIHIVTLSVQLTEEEKKIIELTDIRDHVVCERPIRAGVEKSADPDLFHLFVRHLLKDEPDVYEFENLADANSYANALPGSLKNLKDFINDNKEAPESTSFEL